MQKENGGISFLCLYVFNLSILGKQA